MFTNLITRIKEELAFQRDLAEMEAMDDRQLADIGVTRFELAATLRSGRNGDKMLSTQERQDRSLYADRRAA